MGWFVLEGELLLSRRVWWVCVTGLSLRCVGLWGCLTLAGGLLLYAYWVDLCFEVVLEFCLVGFGVVVFLIVIWIKNSLKLVMCDMDFVIMIVYIVILYAYYYLMGVMIS